MHNHVIYFSHFVSFCFFQTKEKTAITQCIISLYDLLTSYLPVLLFILSIDLSPELIAKEEEKQTIMPTTSLAASSLTVRSSKTSLTKMRASSNLDIESSPLDIASSFPDNVLQSSSIKFLTFNTWGLKYVSKNREIRLKAIADKILINYLKYDVIALQEIWCSDDWQYFKAKLSSKFPYMRYFKNGILAGPGLAIISKIPIKDSFLYRFPINGRPSAFFRGDWYVGKSISVTILANNVAVLNSHMHAPYADDGDAHYLCHRACQAWDFAKLAHLLINAGHKVIITGDLNSLPGSLPYRLLTEESRSFTDSWAQFVSQQELKKNIDAANTNNYDNNNNRNPNLFSEFNNDSLDTPQLQIRYAATTCDSQLNTYRNHCKLADAKRLDYVLLSHGDFLVKDAQVHFTDRLAAIDASYSDHFAYYCELEIIEKVSSKQPTKTNLDSINFLHQRLSNISELKSVISEYQRSTIFSISQLYWRIAHVLISIIALISFVIFVYFTNKFNRWSSIILIVSSIILLITATFNFLIVILFMPLEYRMLEEVKLECQDTINCIEDEIEFLQK